MKTVNNVTINVRVVRTTKTGRVSVVRLYSPSDTKVTVRNSDRSMPFNMDILCLNIRHKFSVESLPCKIILTNRM